MGRIMIAGTGSGCGKTTITCAILGAFKAENKPVVSFKAGPDYIDPMFHKKITGVEARNLDLFLMGEENVKYALIRQMGNISVIEGVMGLYDGIGSTSYGSANHLSLFTQTPVILVVNVKGKSQSLCAEIQGYMNYEENNICGVILNNTNEAMYSFYKRMIKDKLKLEVLGFMPNIPNANIESRHLGLVTANEIADIQKKMELLAEAANKYIDIEKLLSIAKSAEQIKCSDFKVETICQTEKPIIYVAMDKAFCFYYEDNHDLLKDLGAELRFFSPLYDTTLSDDADGLIFWGGYPELYAETLQDNQSIKASLQERVKSGMPVYAECGGFMYLQEALTDLKGDTYSMLGILDGHVKMTANLQNFGYVILTANYDNLLCKKGRTINAHSFHHSVSDNEGISFTATKKSTGKAYPCIVSQGNIFAGYPHINFLGNTSFAKNFVRACEKYRKEVGNGVYIKSDGY